MFIRYSTNSCVLSTEDLRDFLVDQGEDASLVHAQSLILTYELNEWGMVLSNNTLQTRQVLLVGDSRVYSRNSLNPQQHPVTTGFNSLANQWMGCVKYGCTQQ